MGLSLEQAAAKGYIVVQNFEPTYHSNMLRATYISFKPEAIEDAERMVEMKTASWPCSKWTAPKTKEQKIAELKSMINCDRLAPQIIERARQQLTELQAA